MTKKIKKPKVKAAVSKAMMGLKTGGTIEVTFKGQPATTVAPYYAAGRALGFNLSHRTNGNKVTIQRNPL